MRIDSALVSRRPRPPLNSNGGAPPRIWTLLDGLDGYLARSTEQGERRMMLWAVLPMTRSKMRLWP